MVESLRARAIALRDDARDWAAGRFRAPRILLLAFLAYVGVRHLADPLYSNSIGFGGITFGLHELGHVLFGCLGTFPGVAGGSFVQVAAPVAAALVLLRQRDYFGVTVAGAWLAFSLFMLATYVGDARAQELPLVGLTDEPEHDWAFLLSAVGLLGCDRVLAFLVRVLAAAVWASSLGSGGWLVHAMGRPRDHGVPDVPRTRGLRGSPRRPLAPGSPKGEDVRRLEIDPRPPEDGPG